MSLDDAAQWVARQFSAVADDALLALGNHGGFSGARLWRARGRDGPLCLRAWPGSMTVPRLDTIHHLMTIATAAGLAFVPRLERTPTGQTWVEHAGRLWEVAEWMPGRADFHQSPSPARLAAACTALAQLHAAWAEHPLPQLPCPAVRRRLNCLADWTALVRDGWRPLDLCDFGDPVRPFAERAWALLQRHGPNVVGLLAPWQARPVSVQPCLCDLWHDHVLFEGDAVSALLDYGSIKADHVAVDLARLLGSLAGDDAALFKFGLDSYARLNSLSDEERQLVTALDRTGTLLGAANWLRWLFHDGRTFEDRGAVAGRLAALVVRMEKWAGL
jgi:Ser/Thr protein kinase RdoA (MazF antagonist)